VIEYRDSSLESPSNGPGSEADIGENFANLCLLNPHFGPMANGPKMGPKLWETSVKYVNIRPEMIENARAGKVN
jgi:hypothetical protein